MFFFLAYFTLYNRLQCHPPHENWFKCILFNGWVILHCVYVPQLSYPFICWWTSRLFPCCPSYYKQCCNEHWGTGVSFNSGFLGVYAQQWDCWVIRQLCWEGLGAGGEGDDRGWDGWMASPTRWTWIWVNSGSWWWTERPACSDSWGRRESDTTERLNWTELRALS